TGRRAVPGRGAGALRGGPGGRRAPRGRSVGRRLRARALAGARVVDLGSLTAVAAAIRQGKVSPLEVTRHCLERIARLDSRLRAFIAVNAQDALATAGRLEAEAVRGQWRGPLHGVPLAFKDLCAIGGRPASGGTRIRDYLPALTTAPRWAGSWPRGASISAGST